MSLPDKLKSTKVLGFWFFAIIISAGLFTDKLDGGVFVGALTVLFGIFSTANVFQKKVLNEYK